MRTLRNRNILLGACLLGGLGWFALSNPAIRLIAGQKTDAQPAASADKPATEKQIAKLAASLGVSSELAASGIYRIVAEAMVALVVADAILEKFGGDSVTETRRNVQTYLDALRFK